MGLMESPLERGRLVVTPHPVLVDGQRNLPCDLIPGETLYAFLSRHIDLSQQWEVRIGGVLVPVEMWLRVKPKHGQVIEVRAAVGKSVLYIVAMVALTYFTFGAGTIAGWSIGTSTVLGTTIAQAAVYMVGSALINKALGPKPPSVSAPEQGDPTYSLTSQRNTFRPYEPVPLLFGKVKITPDLATDQPYNFNRGNDQYLALILNCGINVDHIEALYNGDTPLSDYDGVEDYYSGFAGMTDEAIPLYSNTDTIAGGSLDDPAGTYVERTSAADAIRLEIDLTYNIYDFESDGDPRWNDEGITAEYRAVGDTTWLPFGSTTISGNKPKVQRKTLTKSVTEGQYEVRVKRNNTSTVGSGAHCEVEWSALRSVQADTGNYKGLARIGLTVKATGQTGTALDQIRGVAYACDLEGWDGSSWTTDAIYISNPGAQILQYARGFYDSDGVLIAGMGLSDEQIDLDAIKAFILHCDANGYSYNYYLKEQRSHNDVLNAIALAGFGHITWAGGKLSVVWAADDQPLSGVVNMATIKRDTFRVDYAFAGGADGIEFTYLDASDWENKTLRVSAPGVTTPLNPARVAGEGITSEAHAAEMARYHLAQSLYQFKSVTYGTDLEHLSYRRLSVLALQHDLTQWGKGGRVQDVTVAGDGTVTVYLDEPVPVGATPYIGLRVPGENVYRVFEVVAPSEETRQIELAEMWPVDLPDVPGDSTDNPAQDTIWIYDFATTPGQRVRVVDVQPEAGLKGATVSVVPEDDAFWTYVKTGDYTPSVPSGMPSARPVVSNIQVDEQVIPQGGTAFTELHLTFDVTGRMDHAVILAQYTDLTDPENPKTDGEVREVAQTRTREASFRIPGNGQYDIIVRPYSVDGWVGGSATVSYTTTDTDAEPPAFDTLSVVEADGGLRRYSWGYNPSTIPPPDLAGAVIRYAEIDPAADPWSIDWDVMTPVGASDGFHPDFFDSFIPPALAPLWASGTTYDEGDVVSFGGANYESLADSNTGHEVTDEAWWAATGTGLTYVFSAKPRTANGIEPEEGEARVTATFSALSLLEQVEINGDLAGDALANAQSALDAADAAFDDMAAMLGAPEWDAETTYAKDAYTSREGVIYKSKANSNLNHEPPNATWWAVAGSVLATTDGLSTTLSGVQTELTSLGSEVDANGAAITSLSATVTSQGDDISALSTALTGVQSDITDLEGDVAANAGAITTLQTTVASQGDDISANTTAITAVQADITDIEGDVAANTSALSTLSATVSSQGGTISSHSSAITALESTVNDPETGLSATATAVELLETSVSTNTAGLATLNAQWSVTLDVNGYVSGVQSVNDGTTAGFYILADQFKVISPGGTGYLYWESDSVTTGGGGVLAMSTTNKRFYLGAGFGAAGDLLMHYGGAGALNAKTMSNATFAVDDSGRMKVAGLWGNFGSGWASGGTITSSYDSSSPATVTINVAAGTYFTLGKSISYSASSGTVSQARDTTVTYYLYYSDAGLSGGSKSLGISTNPNVTYNNIDYVMIGQVDVTVPASGSGSGGGSVPYCVHVDVPVLVVRDGETKRIRAGDVRVGDQLPGWEGELNTVTYSETVEAEGVRMTDHDGHVYTCSASAQWRGLDGAVVVAGKAEGRVIHTNEGVVAIVRVEPIGPIPVQHITAANGWYLAGDTRFAYHHNAKPPI